VTCGRGVRQRTKQCSSGYDPPIEEQETQTENCTGEQVCSEDVTGHSLLARGHANVILRNHVTRTATVHSKTECGLLCSRDPSCRSFNLCGDVTMFLCELNSVTNEDFKHDLYWTDSCSYYNVTTRTTD